MGVKGLTTYLKDNRHKLSYTFELKSKDSIGNDDPATEETHIQVIVDGWSLLFAVYNESGEPWVYGGEYAALAQHVEDIVSAWNRAGIRPTFVFDGPTPPLKYPTLISRLQDNCIKPANLFFRTSAAARSTPRSLSETQIAPPLGYAAILSTLLSRDDVTVEFAEGEADSHIVALAGKIGAYVTGNDSDFVVLNCEGYKGYIPLDEMVWCASVNEPRSSESSSLFDGEASEFQTVTRKKQKGRSKRKESHIELGTGPLPPSHTQSDLSLVLTVYEPAAFAKHVSLPPPLLPLLGALIGNDYASFDFFRTTETSVNRVQRVADTLSSVLREAQSGNAKKLRKIDRGGQGSVMDVIGTTVERLLLWRDPRYPPPSGQIDQVTEKVVQSTLEYALDNPASLFVNVEEDSGQSPHSQSQGTIDTAEQVRSLYLRAYHRGILHPRLIEIFTHGSCFPRLFLEDPDRECCARSIGRPIREVIWRIFATSGGIPDRLEPNVDSAQQLESHMMEDEDELVDVVEEPSDDEVSVEDDDDPLAALRGKLQRLSFSRVGSDAPDATDLSRPVTVPDSPVSPVEILQLPRQSRVVTEYVRRGARIASEDCEVTAVYGSSWGDTDNLTLVQLRPIQDRLNVFLKALGSDTPSVRAIAAEDYKNEPLGGGKLLLVVALRWVLQTLHARAEELDDGSRKRERDKEKWTRSETEAFLSCLSGEEGTAELPSIEERAIQLSAQVLSALEAISWLAQALLLVNFPHSCEDGEQGDRLPVVLGEAEKKFSGRKFHAALAHPKGVSNKMFRKLWDASTEGLGNIFGEERGKRGKKERKEKREANYSAGRSRKMMDAGGMFGALADLDVQ